MGIKKGELTRLQELPSKKAEDFKEFSDLPAWVKTVVSMHDVLGLTWEEACKRVGKSKTAIARYRPSPACKEWRQELEGMVNDPKQMAELSIRASAFNIGLDYLAAYEKAVAAGDYNSVAKMSQDLFDRIGITKKREEKPRDKIQVTLNLGSSLDIPEISATYEELEEPADYEVVDEN